MSDKYTKPRASTTYGKHSYLTSYKDRKHYNSLYNEKDFNISDRNVRERDIESKYARHVKNKESKHQERHDKQFIGYKKVK